jgi:hypothetical protein
VGQQDLQSYPQVPILKKKVAISKTRRKKKKLAKVPWFVDSAALFSASPSERCFLFFLLLDLIRLQLFF